MLLQLLISGLLMGSVFSLIAVGLSLIYGVMNLVNFAHGDFLMLAMYMSYGCFLILGLSPLSSLPIVAIFMFIFGILVYKGLFKRILKTDMVAQMIGTYAVGQLLRGIIQSVFGIEYLTVNTSLSTATANIDRINLSVAQLLAGIGAIIATAILMIVLKYTKVGRALVATSQNKVAATVMGVDTNKMFMLSMGIGCACVGLAGALLTNYYYIFPSVGTVFSLIAFVTVALGGFGSMKGAFLAGLAIGIVQVVGGFYLPSEYKLGLIGLLYLIVTIAKPKKLIDAV